MVPEPWMIYPVMVVTFINIGLLTGLIGIYWKSYKATKSKFSINLLFFGSTFLVKNTLFIVMMTVFILAGDIGPDQGSGREFGIAYLNFIECAALAILYRITRE